MATRAVATGALIPAGAGKCVLIAPRPDRGPFAGAARAALENLARTLSVEWARLRRDGGGDRPGCADQRRRAGRARLLPGLAGRGLLQRLLLSSGSGFASRARRGPRTTCRALTAAAPLSRACPRDPHRIRARRGEEPRDARTCRWFRWLAGILGRFAASVGPSTPSGHSGVPDAHTQLLAIAHAVATRRVEAVQARSTSLRPRPRGADHDRHDPAAARARGQAMRQTRLARARALRRRIIAGARRAVRRQLAADHGRARLGPRPRAGQERRRRASTASTIDRGHLDDVGRHIVGSSSQRQRRRARRTAARAAA